MSTFLKSQATKTLYSHIMDCWLSLLKREEGKKSKNFTHLGLTKGRLCLRRRGSQLLSLSHWFWKTSCTNNTSGPGERNKVWRAPLNSTVTNSQQIPFCSGKYVYPSQISKAFFKPGKTGPCVPCHGHPDKPVGLKLSSKKSREQQAYLYWPWTVSLLLSVAMIKDSHLRAKGSILEESQGRSQEPGIWN